ncbi:MAG: cytochrome c biogenesis CcdA family protein [Fibrobacterota bacterium]
MQGLFAELTEMMQAGAAVTLAASFIWGVLSIVLSPCHLTSIPLIIGFVDSTEETGTGRRFTLSALFAGGILVSIALIGALTASAGRIAGDIGPWANWIGAAVFAVIGLSFLDIIPLHFNGIQGVPIKKKGRRAAFLIGLIFGIALGPCTFAFMAPVLAVSFLNADSGIALNAGILVLYGLGHSLLIVCAGTFTGVLERYLSWNRSTGHSDIIKKIAGVFLLAGSLYFLAK